MREEKITKAWNLYEQGRSYNNRLVPNQYRLVDTNIAFFIGNQWTHLPETDAMNSLPKPVFNIIKRVVSLFVASMTSSATKINFEPLTFVDGEGIDDPSLNLARVANAEVENLFDKFKMDFRIRDALFDGAVTGDYCAHFIFNPNKKPYGGAFANTVGEIEMEMVDGINVMFGNPNNRIVEEQPYILIIGRDTVKNLEAEIAQHAADKKSGSKSKSETDLLTETIVPDSEYQWQAGEGGKIELNGDETGKALVVYMYEKVPKKVDKLDLNGQPIMEYVLDKDGEPIPETFEGKPLIGIDGKPKFKMRKVQETVETVHVTKCTKNTVIYEDIDTGLYYYPIAWGNWERQKNQYHGRSLVTGLIPNQIYINSMFAMIMRHQQMMGFPKIIYNGDLISQWSNEIGQAISVHGVDLSTNLNNVATSIRTADMSTQIMLAIDKAMQYTKECMGATDAQLGNVKPENTSALIALQSASIVPLENPRACLYEWVEDIGRILLDMMGTYYGVRTIVRTTETEVPTGVFDQLGRPMMTKQTVKAAEEFDFSKLKHIWLNTKVDVGASTYWSRIAMVQTLDNLKRDGTLDIIQYLERMPSEYIPDKEALITQLKNQMAQMPVGSQLGAEVQGTGGGAGQALGGEALISTMSPEQQAKFQSLPTEAKKALLTQAQLNNVSNGA